MFYCYPATQYTCSLYISHQYVCNHTVLYLHIYYTTKTLKITGEFTMNLRELELLADKHNVKDTILIVAKNL